MNKKEYFEKLIENGKDTKPKIVYSAVYLFSVKGFDNVGIRELCNSVNIKPSTFYSHFKSKEELFSHILGYYGELKEKMMFSREEVEDIVKKGDVKNFFRKNMEKFAGITGNPFFHTILQIVFMESYIKPQAFEFARENLYYLRKDYTEEILEKLIESGAVRKCDVKVITMEYYYSLKGILDEYLLKEVWNSETGYLDERIKKHIDFFVQLLRKNDNTGE